MRLYSATNLEVYKKSSSNSLMLEPANPQMTRVDADGEKASISTYRVGLNSSFISMPREKTIMPRGQLVLADGSTITGEHFGAPVSNAGEVVFNTGMVGYPEAMTDPSYRGQILVLTYPLIGNYGVPVNGYSARPGNPELHALESDHIQISGLVVSTLAREYSHWAALASLDSWLKQSGVPALCGVDTRALAKKLRIQGCMLGKLLCEEEDTPWDDPNRRNLVAEVSLMLPAMVSDARKKQSNPGGFGLQREHFVLPSESRARRPSSSLELRLVTGGSGRNCAF